jgi:hypothetical protein
LIAGDVVSRTAARRQLVGWLQINRRYPVLANNESRRVLLTGGDKDWSACCRTSQVGNVGFGVRDSSIEFERM